MATPEQIQRALANAQRAGDQAAVAKLSAALAGSQPAPVGVPIGQPNPFAMPRAQAELAQTQVQTQAAALGMQNDAKRLAIDADRAATDKLTKTADLEKAQREAADKERERKLAFAPMQGLETQMRRAWDTYAAGPGSTSAWSPFALKDYLPTDANKQFDTVAAGLGQQGLSAFRVPGAGPLSDADLKTFIAANQPSASDNDATIKEKLSNIERRMAPIYEANGRKFTPYRPKGMIGGGPAPKPAAAVGGWGKMEVRD